MHLELEHTYPNPATAVFAAFCDQQRIREKFDYLGSRNVEFHNYQPQSNGLEADISRDVPADPPAMLKKFIAEWNRMQQKEHWRADGNGGFSGTYEVKLEGIPVNLKGTFRLVPTGETTRHVVTLDTDCRIPLVGKKLAEFVGEKSRTSLLDEFQFWEKSLRERPVKAV